ncbi:MAG: poly(3-hydroxyalkanoate) depolymerase [Pseudomonadales bacterium]|jgi:poly(3-hydroxyalkanoate) depolymerase
MPNALRRWRGRVIRDRFVTVDGHRLRVVSELDRPGVPLVIFNGIGASAGLLHPLVESLGVPVITFDLPGVGGSSVSFLPRRMFQLARLARRLLTELDVERCHVMGISWGGGLAQQFAWQYPEATGRLVLAATSPGALMVPPHPRVILRMATPLRYLAAGYFRNIAGELYGGDFRHDEVLRERHARRMTPPSVVGYLNQLYALSGWTSLPWLHRVRAPTLIMAGEDDPIIPLANARLLARRLPDAELSVFDCGHLFVLTRLPRVCREIEAFLGADAGISAA